MYFTLKCCKVFCNYQWPVTQFFVVQGLVKVIRVPRETEGKSIHAPLSFLLIHFSRVGGTFFLIDSLPKWLGLDMFVFSFIPLVWMFVFFAGVFDPFNSAI